MIIHYHNHIYVIDEIENETKAINLERGYKIVKLIESGLDLKEATLYANYYINNKHNGCIYSDKITSIMKMYIT